MKNTEKTMDKIVALCKNRGFVFPGSEIYGGLANTWDYGPLGAELKKNIKNAWWPPPDREPGSALRLSLKAGGCSSAAPDWKALLTPGHHRDFPRFAPHLFSFYTEKD